MNKNQKERIFRAAIEDQGGAISCLERLISRQESLGNKAVADTLRQILTEAERTEKEFASEEAWKYMLKGMGLSASAGALLTIASPSLLPISMILIMGSPIIGSIGGLVMYENVGKDGVEERAAMAANEIRMRGLQSFF